MISFSSSACSMDNVHPCVCVCACVPVLRSQKTVIFWMSFLFRILNGTLPKKRTDFLAISSHFPECIWSDLISPQILLHSNCPRLTRIFAWKPFLRAGFSSSSAATFRRLIWIWFKSIRVFVLFASVSPRTLQSKMICLICVVKASFGRLFPIHEHLNFVLEPNPQVISSLLFFLGKILSPMLESACKCQPMIDRRFFFPNHLLIFEPSFLTLSEVCSQRFPSKRKLAWMLFLNM